MISGDHSEWLDESNENIQVTTNQLSNTKGFITEVYCKQVPGNAELFWSFGGLTPELSKDNLFNVEGNAFTVYYGESMATLRTLHGCTPPASKIQQADANQQSSPLDFLRSGKKSDALALTGVLPVQSGKKYYFCFYKQNAQADYNYFMLEDLFNGKTPQQQISDKNEAIPKQNKNKTGLLRLARNDGSRYYNVKDFGALGDGKQIDSYAINQAIETAASQGGGTIYFPAGNYLSYSIRLKSHICLMLDAGATIIAAFPSATEGYDEAELNVYDRFQDFGHSHWKNSLLWAIGEEDITICGQGSIYGMGLSREESRLKGVANKAISLKECKNVQLKDLRMVHCGHFALLATGVENLTVDNLLIDTNRDGLDIDCCRNVRISNCTVNTPWDDGIVLKASYGLGYFKDTENVTITNCAVSGYDCGTVADGSYQFNETKAPDQDLPYGRIKFGTESSGGFKNVAISNCVFDHCRGLALETVDGGSLEDVTISNITMRDIFNSPFFLRVGARMRSPEGTPVGKMRRILISNINIFNADSRYASIISGIPGYKIEDVTFSNIRIHYKGDYNKEDIIPSPPENEKVYPEPSMFGTIPASAFYIRHAQNIRFRNIDVDFEQPDFRPGFVLEDAQKIDTSDIRIALPEQVATIKEKTLPDWTQTLGAQSKPENKQNFKANDYGASGDGKTLNTAFIQAAIDDCASKGGGRVEFAPGVYLTGAIFLKSNVELHLAKGVTLKAVNRIEDFPETPTRIAGIEMAWPSAVINVLNQTNAAITGDGIIDGDGKYLWDKYWEMRKDYDKRGLRWIVDYDCKRVRSLLVSESKNITVSNLTFLRAGFWTVQVLYSSYCTVNGIIIRNNMEKDRGPSTDGIDIDSSNHILIENCDIDCNDDNICLKAGRDADGLRVNRPTEYVLIRNCITHQGGGLTTCGSETSGGIRNIYCMDSKALGTSAAMRIKSAMTRGGVVENIYMDNVQADSVKYVLNCDMNWNPSYSYSQLPSQYDGKELPPHWKVMLTQVPPEQGIPTFKNINISNVTGKNVGAVINCIGAEKSIIDGVTLSNISVEAGKAGVVRYTRNFTTNNIQLKTNDNSQIVVE